MIQLISIKRIADKLLKQANANFTPTHSNTYNSEFDDQYFQGYLDGLSNGKIPIHLIQIGANDGETVDPLKEYLNENVSTVLATLIEPQQELADKLKNMYKKNKNIKVKHLAVTADEDQKRMNLYRIKPALWPYYTGITASGITSFDKAFVVNKTRQLSLPDALKSAHQEDYIEKILVEATTVNELLKDSPPESRSNIVLQIDCEGYDCNIVKSIDFTLFKPMLIRFEHSNIKSDLYLELCTYLGTQGYKTIRTTSQDSVARLKA